MQFLLVLFCWGLLLALCWPIALALLLLWPLLWLLSIPFRLLGAVVEGLLAFIRAVFLFPARLLRGR